MSALQPPVCSDGDLRRADLLAAPPGSVDLNGIDFVEVDPANHAIVRVHFLKDTPTDVYGLVPNPEDVVVSGGVRVVGIRTLGTTRETNRRLRVDLDRGGDFSVYTLTVPDHADLDRELTSAAFSFMAACPSDVDCRHDPPCPPRGLPAGPALDYLAKDYGSFRRLLVDLLPQLNPDWTERNPADLAVTLLELLAHEGDKLSYFQDAVANEAYLDTARQRISVRRHARLVDYRMHDGRNAWAAVHVTAEEDGVLPQGVRVLSRIDAPLGRASAPPGPVLDASPTAEAFETDPALAGVVVFETAHAVDLAVANNEIRVHAWGNEECCLPIGTTEAYLFSVPEGAATAGRPELAAGDLLLLEEALGPATGLAPDADPARRQVVRVEGVADAEDELYAQILSGGALQVRAAGDPPLPLLRVRWGTDDALAFPLCLSSRLDDGRLIRDVSVARANLVLADHGLTVDEALDPPPPGRPPRLTLDRTPLTLECRPPRATYDPDTGRLATERRELRCEPGEARPAVALLATGPAGAELWTPVPDLLDSPPFEPHVVAEVDDEGRAHLRFGDGELGRRPADGTSYRAVYRIGNGRAGNVGAEALAHLDPGDEAIPAVRAVRNPLPARGGVDPETIEEVRQLAPEAFRARMLRAVTEADYAEAALRLPEVSGAVATFRWTGSWHTVFVAVDPRDRRDLVTGAGGLLRLAPAFERSVRAALGRVRLAGYDLELRPPRFVPLDVEVEVCAAPGHFRADVRAAVVEALSAALLPDGRRGFFHPDEFTFGTPVHLSRLYAAIERVEGVDAALVRRFQRYGRTAAGELDSGTIEVGPWEVAQLENDPSFVERGVLQVTARGGKA